MKIRPAILVMLLMVAPLLASDRQITLDYTFERPLISEVTIGDDIYHRITMPGAPNGGQPGEPALPAGGFRLMVQVAVDFTVQCGEGPEDA